MIQSWNFRNMWENILFKIWSCIQKLMYPKRKYSLKYLSIQKKNMKIYCHENNLFWLYGHILQNSLLHFSILRWNLILLLTLLLLRGGGQFDPPFLFFFCINQTELGCWNYLTCLKTRSTLFRSKTELYINCLNDYLFL